MEREVWEELVDRVVDDECTAEERRALLEAAERNPEIRQAFEAALRIRELLRSSAGATVPPEFAERLRLAIERSDSWVEREVERPAIRPASTTAARRFGGRRLLWATTGAAVSFAAVALFASNFGGATRWGDVQVAARIDEAPKVETTDLKDGAAETLENVGDAARPEPTQARPTILRRPGNKGEAPKRPVVAVPSDFYTRRIVDAENAKRLLSEFLRICRKNGVAYEKIDGDFELALRKTTPETRRALLEWLDANAPEIGERGETNLAERWDADDKSVRDVRVSFCVAEIK